MRPATFAILAVAAASYAVAYVTTPDSPANVAAILGFWGSAAALILRRIARG